MGEGEGFHVLKTLWVRDVKTLVVYPHGLGDCILATPALKAYKAQGHFIGFAMLERFRSSELFKNNPNVDEILYTKDAWNDYPTFEEGMADVEKDCRERARERGYDEVIVVKHSQAGSKILDTAEALKVSLKDVQTKVYGTLEDFDRAFDIIHPRIPYGFVHSNTGVPTKDFPPGFGARWLRENCNVEIVLEVGQTFRYDGFNINVQFALMAGAKAICVPDSVFFHAACALDKRVNLAYFAKGEGVYNRVKPLHDVPHNVVYELPD